MKKIFVLLALIIFLPACSYFGYNMDTRRGVRNMPQSSSLCTAPVLVSTNTNKDVLPPVSQEEKKRTFTYEDEEMGIKLKYPGSCYFNKGVFQCSDFTMSIWVLEKGAQIPQSPEINFKSDKNETEVKYYFAGKKNSYALVAWYDGQGNKDLETIINKIAKTFQY